MCKYPARQMLLAFLVVLPAISPAGTDVAAPTIQYRDDRLTVHMARVPVVDCVRALETATGGTVRGKIPPAGEISIDLEGVALGEALGRIFGESNFAITYRSDGRPGSIELLGGPLPTAVRSTPPTPAATPSAAGWPSDPETVKAVATLQAFLERNPSVDLPSGLASVLGRRTTTFHDLMKAAATNEDRGVRSRAWRLSVRTLRDDPAVWSAFKNVLDTAPEESVRDFARHLLGPHAEALTRALARAGPEVRSPARALLQQLEAQPGVAASGAAESQ